MYMNTTTNSIYSITNSNNNNRNDIKSNDDTYKSDSAITTNEDN